MASSFIQAGTGGGSGTGTTIAATFGANTKKGSTLLAFATWGSVSDSVTGITDTDGNTWSATPLVSAPDAGNIQAAQLFVLQGGKGGGSVSTITVTKSTNSAFRGLIIAEYIGFVDQSVGQNQTSNTGATDFISSTAKTPLYAGETIVGFSVNSDGTTVATVGTGYTSRATNILAGAGQLLEDKQIVAPVSTAVTATITSTQNDNSTIMVTLVNQKPGMVVQQSAIHRANYW